MENFKKKIELVDQSYKKMLKEIHPIAKQFEKIYANLDDNQIDSLIYYKGDGAFSINKLLYGNLLNLKFDKMSTIFDIVKNSYQSEIDNIKNLDKIISLYKSRNPLKVFRGIGGGKHANEFNNKNINDTHEFLNFLSTSVNPNVAYNFSSTYTSPLTNNKNTNKKNPTILLEFNLPADFNYFYTIWLDSISYSISNNINNINNINKNTNKKTVNKPSKYNNKSKKKLIKNEKFGGSEFEILLPRNCKFKITDISDIEQKFFSMDYGMGWDNYEKHLNTNENVKKIKVIQLDFVEIVDRGTALPSFDQVQINYSEINNNKLKQIYYIPCP